MKEIEVKIEVEDLDKVMLKLKTMGCVFTAPIKQEDRIFIANGTTLPAARGANVLRLRKHNDKFLLTLKQAMTSQLDCIERETEVSDPEQTILMFKDLGFFEAARVSKQRIKTKLNDLEICLDTVENLGSFIEVERLVPEDEYNDDASVQVQDHLLDFLKSLDLNVEKRITTGYDNLLLQRNKA